MCKRVEFECPCCGTKTNISIDKFYKLVNSGADGIICKCCDTKISTVVARFVETKEQKSPFSIHSWAQIICLGIILGIFSYPNYQQYTILRYLLSASFVGIIIAFWEGMEKLYFTIKNE